ncbi:AMP-binding protein [Sungkyunkwania multivorans]|uniref:AMP-binding protein n=1 Tax=Sungkyunkwania multivorans TaxID=1173618 RepID=A0ABW3CZH3_9FLAO
MTPTYKNIHLKFRFNGHYFDREDLKEVAYSLIKEGHPYERSVGDFLIDWLNDYDYISVNTSGSTGKPKLVRLKKQHMVHSAIATGDFFQVSVGDSALHCLPSNFIAGKMMWVRAMILGLEIDMIAPTSNPLEAIERKYDFCAMVPIQLRNSLDRINCIKKMIVGGAAVSNDLKTALQDVDTEVFETYGMTETITHVAARRLNHFELEDGEKNTFKTLPNVEISSDDRGCLVIDAKDRGADRIITNDLVKIYSDTSFEWLGRIDNVVNSGAYKLFPEQIENKLQAIIHERFFVCGTKDEELGERLVLVIEGKEKDIDKLLEKIKTLETLDDYETPKEILFKEKFEETVNGKIRRKATLKAVMA